MGRVGTILSGLAVLAIVALFSVVWVGVFVLTLIAVGVWKFQMLPEGVRKAVASVVIIGVLVGLVLAGLAPNPGNPGSAARSRVPGLAAVVGIPPADYAAAARPPAFDEKGEFRQEFHRLVFELQTQRDAVERALSLQTLADRVIAYGRTQNMALKDLIDAKRAVDESLDRQKLHSVTDLQRRLADFDGFIARMERTSLTVPLSEAQRFFTDFRLQARTISLADVHDATSRLENVLNQLQRQVVGNDVKVETRLGIDLNEQADGLVREQIVAILPTKVKVKIVDASELTLGLDTGSGTNEIFVSYEDPRIGKPPSNIKRIPVLAGVKVVTITRRNTGPAELKELPTRLRLWPFKYFLVSWPAPTAVKLRAILDLSDVGGPPEFPYTFDVPVDAPIREIRVPAASHYASSYTFKTPRREGPEDVLEPETELRPAYFLTNRHIWVELLPAALVFRNSTVQGWKNYLFPENLVAGVVVMFLGGLWGVLTLK